MSGLGVLLRPTTRNRTAAAAPRAVTEGLPAELQNDLATPVDLAPRITAFMLVSIGVLDIATIFAHRFASRLTLISDVLHAALLSASAGVGVAVSVLLICLARGVWLGKRRAWQITVALLAAQLIAQTIQRHLLMSAVCVLVLVTLVKTREQFRAASRPGSRRQAATTLTFLMTVSAAVALVTLDELAHVEHVTTGPAGLALAVAQGLIGIPSALTAPESRYADAVYYLLISMTATTLAVAGFFVLQTARTPRHRVDDERRLRALTMSDDVEDSLAYFATRSDRAVCWTHGGLAGISYKVVAGTALAAGDPIGPADLWPEAIHAFLKLTQDMAWMPAVAAASDDSTSLWRSTAGFSAFKFGDEAVLHVDDFSTNGRRMRNVRQAVARAERAGNVVTIRRLADLDVSTEAALRRVSNEWRGHVSERGFSMGLGRIDSRRDPDSLVVLVTCESEPQALLTLVPWGQDGYSLDVMRRSPTATNGVTELMITSLLQDIPQFGARRVSLNFVVFREILERADDGSATAIDRLWGKTIRGLGRRSHVESLYRFNSKFQPHWQARYLLYPTPASLHRAIWAYLYAESLAPRPGNISPVLQRHARRLSRIQHYLRRRYLRLVTDRH
jgi:lysyl-tRNA synthetase, class II